ncbi:N-acetylmuramoyl-L-alanine amidase [Actinophytocola sp. S1-96]|uniref:N-acetylmuramoyl-L-alanine amidase n=1 Tax=Actinophytocola gossypii TaxID=2812003 RepID=A0ABT2JJS1_9PSEU|nr:N-acetylmuramoyl-L-alanine amidase [Actinophytocola gossypii]
MKIISRPRWGARHERGFGPAPLPASEVWLHHSVTIAPDLAYVDANRDGVDDDEARAMRTLEAIGEQRFGRGISYTFAVMPSGRVYEGHGVDRIGAHTGGRNSISRAIVLVGDFTRYALTEAQLRAVAALLQHGHAAGWWRRARLNGGHQQAPGASTACPGRYAMSAIPRINRLAAGPPVDQTPGEDDDVIRFMKGDSRAPLPGDGGTYGDVVFKVEYAHEFGAIAVRTRVPNANDPGFRAYLEAGGTVYQVPQAVLDAIPDKASARKADGVTPDQPTTPTPNGTDAP